MIAECTQTVAISRVGFRSLCPLYDCTQSRFHDNASLRAPLMRMSS